MPDGGFLVKFDGKEVARCYAVKLDYDEGTYAVNAEEPKRIPEAVKAITVVLERGGGR